MNFKELKRKQLITRLETLLGYVILFAICGGIILAALVV